MGTRRAAIVSVALLVSLTDCWRDDCDVVPGDQCFDATTSIECTFDTCTIDYVSGASTPTDSLRIEAGAVLHIRARLPNGTTQIRVGTYANGSSVSVPEVTLTIDGVTAPQFEPAAGSSASVFAFTVPPLMHTGPVMLDLTVPDTGLVRGGINVYVHALAKPESCRSCGR